MLGLRALRAAESENFPILRDNRDARRQGQFPPPLPTSSRLDLASEVRRKTVIFNWFCLLYVMCGQFEGLAVGHPRAVTELSMIEDVFHHSLISIARCLRVLNDRRFPNAKAKMDGWSFFQVNLAIACCLSLAIQAPLEANVEYRIYCATRCNCYEILTMRHANTPRRNPLPSGSSQPLIDIFVPLKRPYLLWFIGEIPGFPLATFDYQILPEGIHVDQKPCCALRSCWGWDCWYQTWGTWNNGVWNQESNLVGYCWLKHVQTT